MLNRLALRLATVRALRGRTMAGNRVFDSATGPIDDIAVEHPSPVIVVYTDDSQLTIAGRDLYATGGDGRVDSGTQKLIIEVALTQRMQVVHPDSGVPIRDPHTGEVMLEPMQLVTDAGLELTLDILERQVTDALMAPVNSSEWAEMWRLLVDSVGDKQSLRGGSSRDGVRFAGRQIMFSCFLAKDPPALTKIGPTWERFLQLAAATPDLATVLPAIRAAIGTGTGEPDAQLANLLGLSRPELVAIAGETYPQ